MIIFYVKLICSRTVFPLTLRQRITQALIMFPVCYLSDSFFKTSICCLSGVIEARWDIKTVSFLSSNEKGITYILNCIEFVFVLNTVVVTFCVCMSVLKATSSWAPQSHLTCCTWGRQVSTGTLGVSAGQWRLRTQTRSTSDCGPSIPEVERFITTRQIILLDLSQLEKG